MVASFAGYGFCKAHAASFAHITYQSAFLKAHYPLEFYLGLLNAGYVGSYPKSVILNEARRRGFEVLGPHINYSHQDYRAENGGIRIGLLAGQPATGSHPKAFAGGGLFGSALESE
jgi:DNA polymerase III alpha subunit